MKTTFSLIFLFFAMLAASGQRPTPLITHTFTDLNSQDVEPAYNYNFIPPVEADILTDSVNYTPNMDERYFMSVFGPRHKWVSTSNIQYFDFHQGTDITWKVSHNQIDYTENNPPDIQSMSDGVVYKIYNPPFAEAENTETGRYVIIKSHETFAGNPDWGNIYIAYRHIGTVNPNLVENDSITQGTFIGTMGATGATTNTHLHMSVIRRNTGSQINVHPMRVFDPTASRHLLAHLKDAEITQLNYWDTGALFRLAIPYNQANLKEIKITLPGGTYSNTYDFEYVSQHPALERDSNSFVSGLEVFAYPFNRGNDAYCYHWDKHDDAEITHEYPSSPANTDDFAPFLSENLLKTPAYVVDVKVTDLPANYNIEDLKIELIDIYGRGISANGVVSHGDFAWAMIEDENSDAEERGADATNQPGKVNTSVGDDAKDLELTYDFLAKGHQTLGLRFANIGLPANAIVTDAKLQFRADASAQLSEDKLTNLNIKTENHATAAVFEEIVNNLTNRETSESVVEWNIINPWVASEMGPDQQVNITPIVQEVLSRNADTWTNASPLVLLIDGAHNQGKRKADAFDPLGYSRKNAYIYVEYTTDPNQSPNYPPEVFLTNPTDGAEFENLNPITLQAVAFDPDHGLQKVKFYVNGDFKGESFNAPFEFNWQPNAYGHFLIKAVAVDNDNNSTDSFEHEIDIENMAQIQVLEIPLNDDNHDVEEHESGTIWKKNQDLELCYDSYTPNGSNQSIGNQYVGLRFENVGLPSNATITNAYIQFTADETHNNFTDITIWGEKEVSPADFGYAAFNVSSRNMTTANTQWIPNAWDTKFEAGVDQRSTDISAIIQEIIDLQTWQSGEDLVLILHNDDNGRRTAVSHDQSPAKAPKLYIEYTLQGGNNLMAPLTNDLEMAIAESLNTDLRATLTPNPITSDQQLTLSVQQEGETEAVVSIFSNTGQLMNRQTISFVNQMDKSLDLADYIPGVYWVNIQTSEKLISQKLIVSGK